MIKNASSKFNSISKNEFEINRLFSEYIDECKYTRRLRPETIRGYEAVFLTFTRIMPEVQTCECLTPSTMREFFKRLQIRERQIGKDLVKIGIKNSTIKTYWSKLNSFFKWLITNNYLSENPVSKMKPPEPNYDDKRALVKNEIHQILASIMLNSSNQLILKRDVAMIHALLFCGLRKGELISLKVTDIDFNNQLLTVIGITSKSKKTRHIPMNKSLIMHLEEYIKERNKRGYKTASLFVSRNIDNGLTAHGIKHWISRLCKQSGIKFHIHRFRHTFASNLGNMNVGAVKIQKLMGHADIRMTMTYLRSIQARDMKDEIAKLDIDNFI